MASDELLILFSTLLAFGIPLLVSLVIYLLFCFCIYKVGQKFKVGSFLAFCVPIYNFYLLCRCAGLTGQKQLLYTIGSLLPLVQIVIFVYIWGTISHRLGKNFWLFGLLSLFFLPVLVLAFDSSKPSGSGEQEALKVSEGDRLEINEKEKAAPQEKKQVEKPSYTNSSFYISEIELVKINLIDYRHKKKRLFIQYETLAMFLLLMFLFSVMYLIDDKLSIDKEAFETEVAIQNSQITRLSKKTVKVTEALRLKKRLGEILADIKNLKENLEDASYFFDKVRSKVPDKAWLTSMDQRDDMLVITGIAETQPTLALFLNNLKTYSKFGEIALIESIRLPINGNDFYRYTIHAKYK
ncbi:MAG: PilN domain-containing protein [Nitrospinae bacterium]|nr:PilN domain-containing protein [Nitrospinota bacterium]